MDAKSRTDADAKCDAAEAEVRSKEGDAADTSIKFVASPRLSRLQSVIKQGETAACRMAHKTSRVVRILRFLLLRSFRHICS